MKFNIEQAQELLCRNLCAEVRIVRRKNGLLMLDTPFTFPDGDHQVVYLEGLSTGGIRLTDQGHTLMHLSYKTSVASIREGTRGRLFEQLLSEHGISDTEGELSMETSFEELGKSVFAFGQFLTRLFDITFLDRSRVASTFYDDLQSALERVVPLESIKRDYLVPDLPNNENYPVDFCIFGGKLPLFVLGIPGRDKVRLATITLHQLIAKQVQFESLMVFEDQSEIPRRDLARLSDVGGEQVSSLVSQEDLARKVLRRVSAS
jgi:hypothetical protein